MSIHLGPEFAPTFVGRPPRMSDEDFRIWRRWWPTVQHLAVREWFDIGLGGGKPIPSGTSAELVFMWTRNTQKRADVLIDVGSELWLVEVRFAAQANAIGRLLTYHDLLPTDIFGGRPVVPVLVTDFLDPEVEISAVKRGIRYFVA